MKKALWLATVAVVVAGCGSGGSQDAGAEMKQRSAPSATLASAEVPNPTEANKSRPAVTQRAVVQTAEMTVRVKDLSQAEKTVNRLILESGGFVSSSESGDLNQPNPTITMKLRIPAGRFASLMTQFEALGDRLHRQSKAEDVTGALIDFDARLKNMRAEEDSMRESLRKSPAGTYQLELQHRLGELRGEIESVEGQRHALNDLATLSTLDLTLVGASVGMTPTDKGWMSETWNSSTAVLGQVVQGLGSLGVFLLVMSPIWLPIVGLITWLARRSRPRPDVR